MSVGSDGTSKVIFLYYFICLCFCLASGEERTRFLITVYCAIS